VKERLLLAHLDLELNDNTRDGKKKTPRTCAVGIIVSALYDILDLEGLAWRGQGLITLPFQILSGLLHTNPRLLSTRNDDLDIPSCGANIENMSHHSYVVRKAGLTEILGQMAIEPKDVRRFRTRWTIIILSRE